MKIAISDNLLFLMNTLPNPAASVDAPIASQLHSVPHWRRATEQHRSPIRQCLVALVFLAMTCAGHGAIFSLTKDGMAGISAADIQGTWSIEAATRTRFTLYPRISFPSRWS